MFPIKTYSNNNVVVKTCVEDVHKLVNFLKKTLYDTYDIGLDMCEDMHNPDYHGYYIKSTGKAVCSGEDKFDEKVGNEIAFRKVKLSANIKKCHLIDKIIALLYKKIVEMKEYRNRLYKYIDKDIEAIRAYNPKFSPEI